MFVVYYSMVDEVHYGRKSLTYKIYVPAMYQIPDMSIVILRTRRTKEQFSHHFYPNTILPPPHTHSMNTDLVAKAMHQVTFLLLQNIYIYIYVYISAGNCGQNAARANTTCQRSIIELNRASQIQTNY